MANPERHLVRAGTRGGNRGAARQGGRRRGADDRLVDSARAPGLKAVLAAPSRYHRRGLQPEGRDPVRRVRGPTLW